MSSATPNGRKKTTAAAEDSAAAVVHADVASSAVLKSARLQRALTRPELSKLTKGPTGQGPGGYIPLKTLERIENGSTSPTMRQFTSLCDALDIRGSVLLTRIEELTVYLENLPVKPKGAEEYQVVATTWLLNR